MTSGTGPTWSWAHSRKRNERRRRAFLCLIIFYCAHTISIFFGDRREAAAQVESVKCWLSLKWISQSSLPHSVVQHMCAICGISEIIYCIFNNLKLFKRRLHVFSKLPINVMIFFIFSFDIWNEIVLCMAEEKYKRNQVNWRLFKAFSPGSFVCFLGLDFSRVSLSEMRGCVRHVLCELHAAVC